MKEDGICTFTPHRRKKKFKTNIFKNRNFKLSKNNEQYVHAVLYFVDLPNCKLPGTRH